MQVKVYKPLVLDEVVCVDPEMFPAIGYDSTGKEYYYNVSRTATLSELKYSLPHIVRWDIAV